jgi:hypothetical protein
MHIYLSAGTAMLVSLMAADRAARDDPAATSMIDATRCDVLPHLSGADAPGGQRAPKGPCQAEPNGSQSWIDLSGSRGPR